MFDDVKIINGPGRSYTVNIIRNVYRNKAKKEKRTFMVGRDGTIGFVPNCYLANDPLLVFIGSHTHTITTYTI